MQGRLLNTKEEEKKYIKNKKVNLFHCEKRVNKQTNKSSDRGVAFQPVEVRRKRK